MEPIYLDHNATTPIAPEVVEAMLPWLSGKPGNASSRHLFGREASLALDHAREQVAAFINCHPSELVFTSGGTESNNLALIGAARSRRSRRDHLVVGASEHYAVLEPAGYLSRHDAFRLDTLPVDIDGFAVPERLAELVSGNTALVSVMTANNETGAIQDIATLSTIARKAGALFHTDAVQVVGKMPVDIRSPEVDLLSLCAHKIYGPIGVGALFIRRGVRIEPLFFGGTHERRRRPGTENVAGAVGMAKALEIAGQRMADDWARLTELADHLIDGLLDRIPDTTLNSPRHDRIAQTVNVSFAGVDGESVLISLDEAGIACSSGSACTSGATEPSHVLTAMGRNHLEARSAIRFSLGRSTTRTGIDRVLDVLPPIIERQRSVSAEVRRPSGTN